MSHNFFIFWALIIYGISYVANYVTSIETQDSCNDDLCLIKNHSQPEKTDDDNNSSLSHFNYTNDNKFLNESEIHFVAVSEKSSNIKKDDFVQKLEKPQITQEKKLEYVLKTTENIITSVDNFEELSNVTDGTEFSESTMLDILNSTVEPNVTEKMSTTTIKLSTSTSQPPFIASHFSLSQNHRKKQICFCDMSVNKCDINCCCDQDCSLSHFKVFTKCDDENEMIDAKYCYKNNFIFENNTSHKKIQSKGGLFCIVKENLNFDLIYETKTVLKTMEAFNKSLSKNSYAFSYKAQEKLNFSNEDYISGSPIWSVQKGQLIPFKIPYSSVGLLCNSEVNIKYLTDQIKICFYQQHAKTECKNSKVKDVLQHLKDIKIISNPNFLNKSQSFTTSEICKANMCIEITPFLCESSSNTTNCTLISGNSKDFFQINCLSALSHIQYQIWHNGSKGIIKIEAYLWVKNLPETSNKFLLQLSTEVKFMWVGFPEEVLKRSGNPGYLTGKPILAGKKIYNVANDTISKKEAIELSVDPKHWLSVLGSKKGICSSKSRIPINFRENSQHMCSLKLNKNNFSKEKCTELQMNIFKLLIGNDVINETKENFFNKFVATFGNSRVEETGDWVQVMIDLFPIMSSQTSFKSSYYQLTCKNVITDLYINIVYSNIGSFLAPQAKILGVAFQFGKHKDLSYYCDTPDCKNTFSIQYFKLSSAVHFIDTSKPAIDAFAEPLSLETKLPHDFFYPFFSKSFKCQILNKMILVLFCVCLFF